MSRIRQCVNRARFSVGIKFTMPKMFVPVDCQIPATAKDTMARQLYQAGIISKADYEKMLGVIYDGDFEPEMEDFDDETFQTRSDFDQSEFASYEDFEDIAPEQPVPDDIQPDKTAVPVPDAADPAPEGETK